VNTIDMTGVTMNVHILLVPQRAHMALSSFNQNHSKGLGPYPEEKKNDQLILNRMEY
jgi:hypothetical protein